MMFPVLQKVCGGISDMNNGAAKNIFIRCRFSFSDVLYVVAALYNSFQTSLQPSYKYGGWNLSSTLNYL